MGVFSGILGGSATASLSPVSVASSSPSWASSLPSIAGGVAGGALNVIGGIMGNRAASRAADAQRQWQERMRATQYQTSVDDLKKAGLNPMLAYTQGGAGTPSGATAQVPQSNVLGTAASSAAQIAQAMAQLQLTKVSTADMAASIAQRESSTDTNSALAEQARATAQNTLAAIPGTEAASAREKGSWKADVEKRKAESKAAQFGLSEAEASSKFYSDTGPMAQYLKSLGPWATTALDVIRMISRKGK